MLTKATYPIAIACALLLAGSVGGWAYHRGEAGRSRQRIASINAELQTLASRAALAQEAAAQNADKKRALEKLAARVPTDSDLGNVLEPLSSKLAQVKVREQEIVTRPVVVDKQMIRTPVTLRFKSSALDAHQVLRHLESSPRLLRIDRLKIEQAASRDLPQVEIEFSAFSIPAEESDSWTTKL